MNGTCTGTIFWVPASWGLGQGSKKFNFLNKIMWHIKLKGLSSRPGYTEKFYPTIILVTLEWGQRVNYHMISSRAWGFVMARHGKCSSLHMQKIAISRKTQSLCDILAGREQNEITPTTVK